MKRFARFLPLALLAALVPPAAAKTIYVSVDGPGGGVWSDYYYDSYEGRWYYYDDGDAVYIDGEPGDRWENAYSSISYACDEAEPGDTILVGPGTYDGFSMWDDKEITIRSVAGAEQTIIDDSYRCVWLGATDRIIGFTLQNASEEGLCGGYADACVIRNCGSIKGNDHGFLYGAVGGADGSILTDCVIENCLGGGASDCTLDRCIVRNCRGNQFGGLNSCIAYNTLVVGNRSEVSNASNPYDGHFGGATDSTLYNCTVVGNYAQRSVGGVGSCFYVESNNILYLHGDDCRVYNSIVVNNTCGRGTTSNYGQYESGVTWEEQPGIEGSTFAYSCSYPKPAGTGNIGTAPKFSDSDYRLAAGSPSIDAGNNSYVYGAEDIDGFQRIYGSRVDMGAYEYVGRKICVVHFDPNEGSVPVDAIQVPVGTVLGSLPVPFRHGWRFEGWYDDPDGGALVTAQTTASGRNMYLYAHWSEEADSVWQPVYRFYSKSYKGHFYTIDPEERATLMCTNPNWKYEGVAYYAATEEVQGTVPLYRFYSKSYRGHFFTVDEDEMWTVRNTNPNWKYEGVAFYVYPSRRADPSRTATAIYRFWSKGYRHHFFTIDEDEMWTLRETNPNWKYEGVAFYAYEWEP